MAGQDKLTNYWDYIRTEDLLNLQGGLENDDQKLSNDEVRFIAIHQIDELWMKLILRELASARDLFALGHVPETSLSSASASLRRIKLTLEFAGQHFALMETMPTQAYLEFRDKLFPASGFQSAQLREIEILLGLADEDRIPLGGEASYRAALRNRDGSSSPSSDRVDKRESEGASLKDCVYTWLARSPIQGSTPADPGDSAIVDGYIAEVLANMEEYTSRRAKEMVAKQALTESDITRLEGRYRAEIDSAKSYLHAEEITDEAERPKVRRLRAAILFIDSNRHLPLLSWPAEIIDGLIAAEQALLIFRQRHARMVERVIGRRVGTGGSAGVDYLDQTALKYRIFKEIWAGRTMLMKASEMPPPSNQDYYDLRSS